MERTGNPVSLEEAEAFCRRLTSGHYENFSVASWLLPRRLRRHFANIYAYCRMADDFADESQSADEALRRLDAWQEQLAACYQGKARHPVFIALRRTILQFDIPVKPFQDLLDAFRQDQRQTRYRTWEELLEYCSRSANPVGRLVLCVIGHRDEHRQALSDSTCTALQLANFWQDVSRDFARGRVYIPSELLDLHGYTEASLAQGIVNARWVSLMKDLLERTRALFTQGLQLPPLLTGRTRLAVELFSRGGLSILRAVERIDYDTLHHRPCLTAWDKRRLVAAGLLRLSPERA